MSTFDCNAWLTFFFFSYLVLSNKSLRLLRRCQRHLRVRVAPRNITTMRVARGVIRNACPSTRALVAQRMAALWAL